MFVSKKIIRKLTNIVIVASLPGVLIATAVPNRAEASSPATGTNLASISSSPVSSADMTGDVIYQLITDRFYDGDTTNNNPNEASGEYSLDKSNWQLYWGGDFAGVTQKCPILRI